MVQIAQRRCLAVGHLCGTDLPRAHYRAFAAGGLFGRSASVNDKTEYGHPDIHGRRKIQCPHLQRPDKGRTIVNMNWTSVSTLALGPYAGTTHFSWHAREGISNRLDLLPFVAGTTERLATKKAALMTRRAVFRSIAAAVFMLALNCSCLAATPGAAEAKALLDKAVAYFDSNGVARAFCAFNDADGAFHKGPLYVFAVNMDGVYFAHSAAPTLIGTSLRDTRDATGQPIANLVMEAVATQQSAPVEYMWLNYETNKVEKKQTFLKRVENFILGVGYYTR